MKRHRITVSSAASLDTVAIVTYVATTDGIQSALVVDELIDDVLRSLDEMANRGRIVPELRHRGITAYREIIASPYRIIYRLMRKQVWVLAVVDGRRDIGEILYERTRRDVLGEPD